MQKELESKPLSKTQVMSGSGQYELHDNFTLASYILLA